MPGKTTFPTTRELLWSTIQALKSHEGAATNEEIEASICKLLDFTEELRSRAHKGSQRTEIGYRAGWARTALRKKGFIGRSGHAKWRLTATGLNLDRQSLLKAFSENVANASAPAMTVTRVEDDNVS